ncbi:excisionase family DNA-binding protein [Streptomyces sp. NBC_00879]|uniref:excisionase family DNA-binding protein n=1 Tax=Streptomyces sp. NBC_00879 TaxID=2975855 RepID=UPI003865141A|nr:excisionase family DNA-binding protein [Streptomyces sp. NBC_00879]
MAERRAVDTVESSLVLLTVEEAAQRLRIGRTTCFKLVIAGELESVTVGRLRRVPPDALPAYVAKLRRPSRAA